MENLFENPFGIAWSPKTAKRCYQSALKMVNLLACQSSGEKPWAFLGKSQQWKLMSLSGMTLLEEEIM